VSNVVEVMCGQRKDDQHTWMEVICFKAVDMVNISSKCYVGVQWNSEVE
jgi:hypothetical protein